MNDQAKVITARDPSRIKTLFQGLEKDARLFVERNFPRHHIEPPGSIDDEVIPDVKVVTPDGGEHTYHEDTGWTQVKNGTASASSEEGPVLA